MCQVVLLYQKIIQSTFNIMQLASRLICGCAVSLYTNAHLKLMRFSGQSENNVHAFLSSLEMSMTRFCSNDGYTEVMRQT